jgi:hypothetical protein
MTDKDHRATLRARPPGTVRSDRVVQTSVDAETYKRLYRLAEERDISLRALIRETIQNLVGTR